jgi:signal recognition particle subunit SRP72
MHSLSVQTATLESSGPPALPTHQPSHVASVTPQPVDEKNDKPGQQQTKAPRKSRVPKHVIPGVTPPPDPERWIKKRERTRVETRGGKRGGKKKEGMGAGATQGSSVGEFTDAAVSGHVPSGKKGKKGR